MLTVSTVTFWVLGSLSVDESDPDPTFWVLGSEVISRDILKFGLNVFRFKFFLKSKINYQVSTVVTAVEIQLNLQWISA